MSEDLVAVEVVCKHDPTHEHDTVYLRPRLGLAAGIAVQSLIVARAQADDKPRDAAAVAGDLAEAYLLHGVADWTLGLPVTEDTIRSELLADFERAAPVADAADELYMTAVIAPLIAKAQKSLPTTSSNGLTSARGSGQRSARKRSKPSSTTTIPMGDTVATSA